MTFKNRTLNAFALVLLAAAAQAGESSHQRVAWSTLAQVKESPGKSIEFSGEVAALDRKRVAIQGFRIPLEVKTHFLVAAKPSDCEHCIEGGPESYVEVFSKEPVKATFGRPLTVTGKLELVRNSPSGSYYRLTEAEFVLVD